MFEVSVGSGFRVCEVFVLLEWVRVGKKWELGVVGKFKC